MKGKELIEWIKANNAEDLYIEIQYRDGSGFHYGRDEQVVPCIEKTDYGERIIVL